MVRKRNIEFNPVISLLYGLLTLALFLLLTRCFLPYVQKALTCIANKKKCDRLWRFKYRMNRVIISVLEKNVSHVRSKNKGRLHLPGIFIKNISLSSSKRKLTAASKNSLLSPSFFQVNLKLCICHHFLIKPEDMSYCFKQSCLWIL